MNTTIQIMRLAQNLRASKAASKTASKPFPMDKLPADLLPLIIDIIVKSYLGHSRQLCDNLGKILRLRLVCRSFNEEVIYSVQKHITLPNLPAQFFSQKAVQTFRMPKVPEYSSVGVNSSSHISSLTNTTLLSSVLYNSALSLRNRHIGTPIIYFINRCVRFAQALLSDESPARRFEIAKLICTLAAERKMSGWHWDPKVRARSLWSNRPLLREGDEWCIASALGCITFLQQKKCYLQEQGIGKRVLIRSGRLGCPLHCAIVSAQTAAVKCLIDHSSPPYIEVTTGHMETAMRNQHIEILGLLIKSWFRERSEWSDAEAIRHWSEWMSITDRAIEMRDAEILECIAGAIHDDKKCVDPEVDAEETRGQVCKFETLDESLNL